MHLDGVRCRFELEVPADGIAAMALKEKISPHHLNTLEGSLSKRSTSPPCTYKHKLADSLLETIPLPKIKGFIRCVNLRVRPHVTHTLRNNKSACGRRRMSTTLLLLLLLAAAASAARRRDSLAHWAALPM